MSKELEDIMACKKDIMELAESDGECVMEDMERIVEKWGFRRCIEIVDRMEDDMGCLLFEFLHTVWLEQAMNIALDYDMHPFNDSSTSMMIDWIINKDAMRGVKKESRAEMQRALDAGIGHIHDGRFYLGPDKPRILRGLK